MEKIVIICLDAKGTVLRSWSILPAIFKKFPQAQVTWITNPKNVDLFKGNPYKIDVLSSDETIKDSFDILYNFDVEEKATSLATKINAKKKFGFYSESGYPAVFNSKAEYYLNTLFDDELKKSNKKTYQEMMFEVAELPYHKEHCSIVIDSNSSKYAQDFKSSNGLDGKKIIGIHMGASPRWPSKVWDKEKVKDFIIACNKSRKGVILFGGPNEVTEHQELTRELQSKGISFARNNPTNSDMEFVSLVNICDFMVCSDSYALHVSLALKKKTIGLFFCTSPDEIESYELLTKLVAPKLYHFFPERMNEFNKELVNSISVKQVLDSIK